MLKRSHVRQFLAVVDTGSFTAAASRIGVTQPTLSAGIRSLEKTLGGEVFTRRRRNLRITEIGAKFLPIAREIEKGFHAASAVGTIEQASWPSLRVGAMRTIAGTMLRLLVGAIPSFNSIELVDGTDGELKAGLAAGRLDLAFVVEGASSERFSTIPLLTEKYEMFVPSGHSLGRMRQVSPNALGSEIMIARRSCELLSETSKFFVQHGVRPRFALRSHNDERCMEMVAQGLGITTAPSSFHRDGIQALSITGYDYSRTVCLAVNKNWMSLADNSNIVASITDNLAFPDHISEVRNQ